MCTRAARARVRAVAIEAVVARGAVVRVLTRPAGTRVVRADVRIVAVGVRRA